MYETMQFCRQFSRELGGYTAYRGEDAFPLCTPAAMAVADGLGGSGAIYHSHVHPDCFCRDLVGRRLLEQLFCDPEFFRPVEPLLVEVGWDHSLDDHIFGWAGRDFFELAAVKEHYEKRNLKRSAYFGSRIAMLLFRILSHCVDREKIFAMAATLGGREELEKRLTHFFLYGMHSAAKAAQLRYESGIEGLSMLGTTLCACFVRDCADEVEALYLVCGDSQAYVLSEEGLALACGDHIMGMSRHLNLSFPEKARLTCTLRRFAKPCMLLCATDGCFDAYSFRRTPMAFELALLEAIGSAESMEGLAQVLTDFFDAYGRHDDSSSMAACLYGMDYAQLRNMAHRRRQQLEQRYPEVFTDKNFLHANYGREYSARLRDLDTLVQTGWDPEKAGIDPCCIACALRDFPEEAQIGEGLTPQEARSIRLEDKLSRFIDTRCPALEPGEAEPRELRQRLRQARQELLPARERMERQQAVFLDYYQSFSRLGNGDAKQESEE